MATPAAVVRVAVALLNEAAAPAPDGERVVDYEVG